MNFKQLAKYLQKLEETTVRNQMTEILAELFSKSDKKELGKMCLLLQGRVAPLYEAVEFGLAEKMIIRAIAEGLSESIDKVTEEFKKDGDLGITTERIKNKKVKSKITNKNLKINEVFRVLSKIATAGGGGSQEKKIKLMGKLIKDLDPLSCRYVVRIPINKLRLGFSDMTILDSLSWMISGSKELRPEIERAYNVRPDISFISETLKDKGINGLKRVEPEVGIPILMAKAERMGSSEEIIDKIGKCAVEPKYDGFRVQCHINKNEDRIEIKLFSRNLENVTEMYPDIIKGLKIQIDERKAIIEGEAVAYNPNTGEYLPFQETVQRKRKYNIEAKAKEIPLKLFAFELLYKNGKSFLNEPYKKRREELEGTVRSGETIILSDEKETDDPKELENIFDHAVSRGLEGIMAKKLDGIYRAGSRDFAWIKFKRSYAGKLLDTIDCVVMGYDFGQGKRSDFGIGDFLIGVYDKENDKYLTVAKIGTGLTDEEWKLIKERSDKLKVNSKPNNFEVDKLMECDVWIEPSIVVEIRADEITRSPVHTAGREMGPTKTGNAQEVKQAGYALRFPRLERFRDDKKPTDATTIGELYKMYNKQLRK